MSGEVNFTGRRVRLKCDIGLNGKVYKAGTEFQCYSQIGAWCRVEDIHTEIQQDYFELVMGAPVPRFPAEEIAKQLQIEKLKKKEMRLAEFAAKELAKYKRGDFSAAVDLNKPKDPEPSDFENEVFD